MPRALWRPFDPYFQYEHRQSLWNFGRAQARSTVYSILLRRTTTFHRIGLSIYFFFLTVSIFLGVSLYFLLIYLCSQGSDMPVTREIPAIGIFSSNNLSTISHCDWVILLFFGFSTNCLPHSLHEYFCLPLCMDPFFTTFSELQAGQFILIPLKIKSKIFAYH